MKSTTEHGMGHYIATRLARTALCVVLFAVSFLTMRAVVDPAMQFVPSEAAPRAVEAPSPVDLGKAHDCWSGVARADMTGRLPGHVVVTVDGEARYADPLSNATMR